METMAALTNHPNGWSESYDDCKIKLVVALGIRLIPPTVQKLLCNFTGDLGLVT